MNDHLIIRDAASAELDAVSMLLKRAYLQYAHSMPAEAWQDYLSNIVDVGSRLRESALIVALWDHQLAGSVTLYLDAAPLETWPPGWAGIRLLAVDPAFRNHGIGRALMDECVRRCREKGIANLGLHTNDMMTAAVRLYEKMGFVRAQEFDFKPAPGVVVMAYKLAL